MFDQTDLTWCVVVGMDHDFASGAVVGRATTHQSGRPLLRVQRDHLGLRNQIVYFFNFWSWIIRSYIGITSFLGKYVAMHARWRHNGRRM